MPFAYTPTGRNDSLKSVIGKCFSKTPCPVLAARMDRPPAELPRNPNGSLAERNGWKTINPSESDRIEATLEYHSWRWPICMPYAVLTVDALGLTVEEARRQELRLADDQGADTMILDEHGDPRPLLQIHIARLLGVDKRNVGAKLDRMDATKRLRFEGKRVYLVSDPPPLTANERRKVIHMDDFFAGLDLPPGAAILREDLEFLASIPDKVVRTDYFRRFQDIYKDYLRKEFVIRAERDQARRVIRGEARILISQETENREFSASSSLCADLSTEEPEPQPTTTKPAPSSAEPPPTAEPTRQTHFNEGVKAEFAGMPQGMPTPAQLAKAFDLLPVNVDPQEFALFLRPRIERLTHAGGLVAVMKEFGTSRSAVPPAVPAAPARAAARGAPTPQQARNEHIEELKLNIAAAERIANNRVMPPPEREHQRQRAADLRAELDKLLDSEEALPAIAAKGGI